MPSGRKAIVLIAWSAFTAAIGESIVVAIRVRTLSALTAGTAHGGRAARAGPEENRETRGGQDRGEAEETAARRDRQDPRENKARQDRSGIPETQAR
ncbi:hypothetical protein GCM10027176_32700 [Actinoallomurus bryophytorum]